MKKFLSSVWTWIKAHWKIVLGVLAAGFALLAGVAFVKRIVAVMEGTVSPSSKLGWEPTPDKTMISVIVEPGEKPQIIPLPPGVTSDKVKAVGVDPNDSTIAVVEVLHEKTDRIHPTAISGSALDALRSSKP